MKRKNNTSKSCAIVILIMLFWIPCSGQDKVSIDRDSLFNVLMNVAELKIEVKYLQGLVSNQKLIIQSQGIVVDQTELKVEILTERIETIKKKQFWPILWAYLKGMLVGVLVVMVI